MTGLRAILYPMFAAVKPDAGQESPRLDPLLERKSLAAQFRHEGRVNIRNVLAATSANRLHDCLKHEVTYRLCTNIGGTARALENLSAEQRNLCTVTAWREVGLANFRFLYEMHMVSFAGEPYADPGHYLAEVVRFLNGSAFLGLARDVTGISEIEFADAQATLYRNGHFLTAHDDRVPQSHRLAAYVLGFTPAWRPEWGGLLEFIDDRGDVEKGYLPGFNTLKLFRVPMSHHVSAVAPHAAAPRYSITGWLRSH